MDEINTSGYLSVALYNDYAPYSWSDKGQSTGIDVDLAHALGKALGVDVKIIMRNADESIDDDLRNNVWRGDLVHRQFADVMLHVPVDKQLGARNPLAVITAPYFQEEMGVVADRSVLPTVDTFGHFVSEPIGVELDTAGDFFLSAAFSGQLQQSIQRGRTFAEAAQLYVSGKVSALMASLAQCEWVAMMANTRQSHVVQPPMPGLARAGWPVGLAVKEDSRDLGYALGDALQALVASGEMKSIFARYGVTYQAPEL